MILPFRFLLAFVGLAAVEALLDPESPQRADSALAVFSLSVALFLSFYAIVILCDVAARRSRGWVARLLEVFVGTRHLLPILYWFALLLFARWDAWVDYRFASAGLTLSSLVLLAPYFIYEALALLGEFLLEGRVGAAGDRVRSTIFLAPMLFLMTGVFDLASSTEWTRAAVYEIGMARGAVWVSAFVVLFGLLPLWFAWVYRTRPLFPETLRAEFFEIAKRSGVSLRRIREWPTQNRALNALLIGPFRWTRSVFFTDLILARFSREQLHAVFAHEIGHARERHVLRSIAFFIALPLLASHVLMQGVERLHAEFPGFVPATSDWMWLAALLLCLACLAWPFSRMRHRFEHEADLRGAQVLGASSAMVSALEQVERYMPRSAQRGSFFHPSTRRRIELLERAEDDPESIAVWRRGTKRLQLAFGLALLAAGAFSLPFAVEAVQRDYPGYLLARGEVQPACEAFEAQKDMPVEERSRGIDQARRAALIAYGDTPPPLAELRRRSVVRGKRALRREDFLAVRGWFGLARRLGSDDEFATAVSRYLEANTSGDQRTLQREMHVIRSMSVPAGLRRAVARLLDGRRS